MYPGEHDRAAGETDGPVHRPFDRVPVPRQLAFHRLQDQAQRGQAPCHVQQGGEGEGGIDDVCKVMGIDKVDENNKKK